MRCYATDKGLKRCTVCSVREKPFCHLLLVAQYINKIVFMTGTLKVVFFFSFIPGRLLLPFMGLSHIYLQLSLLNSQNMKKADSICKKVQCIAVVVLQTSWGNDVLDSKKIYYCTFNAGSYFHLRVSAEKKQEMLPLRHWNLYWSLLTWTRE